MYLHAPNFSLEQTLSSGQLFRYAPVPEGFLVSHGSRAFVLSQRGDMLTIHFATENTSEAWLRNFFALEEIVPTPTDDYSRAALAHCGGMRICNQEPWECLIGFLCSQNNNVPRIRQLMTGLAKVFGTQVQVGPYSTYLFPEPGAIKSGKKLDSVRAGYRATYIANASTTLTYEMLEGLYGLEYEDAKEQIQLIAGIGPKVADCILLFAYGHSEAFPIDTWVEHIMRTKYKCKTKEQMRRKAHKLWGEQAGVMQQYLFHYARTA